MNGITTNLRLGCFIVIVSSLLSALQAANFTVNVNPSSFSPSFLEINPGDTVTWVNRDDFYSHTVTSDNNAWNRGYLFEEGDRFSLTFNDTGTYPYHDDFDSFTGVISVVTSGNTPPSITITSPSSDSIFVAPATFTIEATASDSDGTVSSVEFFQNGSSLGMVASPYSMTISNLAAGVYSFSAVATDDGSLQGTSSINISVITNAVISAPSWSADQFAFDITGVAGQNYVIEVSTDLVSWSPLNTSVAPAATFNFTDSEATNVARFYRIKSQ